MIKASVSFYALAALAYAAAIAPHAHSVQATRAAPRAAHSSSAVHLAAAEALILGDVISDVFAVSPSVDVVATELVTVQVTPEVTVVITTPSSSSSCDHAPTYSTSAPSSSAAPSVTSAAPSTAATSTPPASSTSEPPVVTEPL
ncbi:hypothetical protein H4S02_013072, partial [Coemansia sp. RSA 2611]